MQNGHIFLSMGHLFCGEHIAVLQTLVFLRIVETLTLDTGHVQNIQLGDGIFQRSDLGVGDVVLIQHAHAHIIRQHQLLGGDEHEADAGVTAHGFDERVDGSAVLQVAAQADDQVVQPAHLSVDGQQVGQGLGGVLMATVTGIDHRDGSTTACHVGSAFLGMAHGNDVGIVADGLCGVRNAFTLGSGGRTGLGEAQHIAAQLQHSCFEAKTGTGGGFKEQGGQGLMLAGIPISFGMGGNILSGGDQRIQLRNGKIQNRNQASHIT